MWKKLKDRLSRMGRWLAEPAHMLGTVMIALAAIIIIVGYVNQHAYSISKVSGETVDWFKDTPFVTDFYANISAELASIAITILIVDYLYRLRDEKREDQDLILQAGSPDNAFAREAVRKIRAKGKLKGEKGILQGAYLQGAMLLKANLQEANLQGAMLQEASLHGANLEEAHLEEAHLDYKVDLRVANLQGAYLQGAILLKANLQDANLQGAHLQGAHLQGAHLQGAHLQGAHLQGARLHRANLQGANLQGAKGWAEKQLRLAYPLEGAIMPDGTLYEEWIAKRNNQE